MGRAIDKGITYVSVDIQELPLENPEFINQYKEELKDGKDDILAIQGDIEDMVQSYETLFADLAQQGLPESLQERHRLLEEANGEYQTITNTICMVLDTYMDMANMIKQIETDGGNPAYLWHRKQELFDQNQELNKIFDHVDYYISQLVELIGKEIEYTQGILQGATVKEEDQVGLLFLQQHVLSQCVDINRMLLQRLQLMVPRIDGLRKDVTTMQVHSVKNDVEERRKRLQEMRQQATVEDVTDYADLEGQYRHNYDEEGNHIGTEEGGDGGNRKSLTAILVVTAIVIAIFAAYVYMK